MPSGSPGSTGARAVQSDTTETPGVSSRNPTARWREHRKRTGSRQRRHLVRHKAGRDSGGARADAVRWASWTVYTTDDGLIHHRIYGIDQTPDGVIWVGTNGGLGRFNPVSGQWSSFLPSPDLELPAQKIRTLSATHDVWIGQAVWDGGAAYLDGDSFNGFSAADGLASDAVWEIFQSRDGTVWAGTAQGLSRYDGTTWISYTDRLAVLFPYGCEALGKRRTARSGCVEARVHASCATSLIGMLLGRASRHRWTASPRWVASTSSGLETTPGMTHLTAKSAISSG